MTTGGHGTDGLERRGLMFVLSSPSGAGKTTLSRLLIKRMPGLRMSVSATTRPMRPGEVNGKDYSFVDKATFDAMVKADELLEWATVFDNSYGTPRGPAFPAPSLFDPERAPIDIGPDRYPPDQRRRKWLMVSAAAFSPNRLRLTRRLFQPTDISI